VQYNAAPVLDTKILARKLELATGS